MKAKLVNLLYGVKIGDDGDLQPVIADIEPFTLTLLEPVDSIAEIVVRANTLAEVIETHDKVSRDHRPGTAAYGRAFLLESVARRCEPALTQKQLDRMAGVDYDALLRVIDNGVHPETGAEAFRLKPGVSVERSAVMRLHTMDDRKIAEQRLTNEGGDEAVLFHANLTWYVTRFGEVDEKAFDSRPRASWPSFLNITWNDFQLLTRHLMSRDYKALTDILDGKVEVGGKPIPFQGGAPAVDPADPAKDGKRGGRSK